MVSAQNVNKYILEGVVKMAKKSKKQTQKQQPNRASEKKRIRKEKRLAPVTEAVNEPTLEQLAKVEAEELESAQEQFEAEQEALGNNGEPIPAEINEEELVRLEEDKMLQAEQAIEETKIQPFDPKKFVEEILKKHGV